jgi:hypothetical protein
MTVAVCFKCGEIKFGAFSPCQSCGAEPKSDDDLVLSLAMTDHYHERPALQELGQKIKKGELPHLSAGVRRDLRNTLQQARSDKVFAKMMEAQQRPGKTREAD